MNSKRETDVAAEPVRVPDPLEEERLDDILTNDEIAEIRREEFAKADTESKKARKLLYAQAARDEARRAAGTMDPTEAYKKDMAEMVTVFVDLPRLRKATGGEMAPDPIIIDQTMYYHGHKYEVDRGKAIYLYYLMDQAKRHVNAVDGRPRTFYNGSHVIYQGGQAMGGPSAFPFDTIHRRPGQ